MDEGARGLAVLRGRTRRQPHSPVQSRRAERRSTPSLSDARRKDDGLCLSDYILGPDDNGRRDHLALFVVHGRRRRPRAQRSRQAARRFFLAHALQALAIETAEGCAEWLHRRIREDWGFPDPPALTMQERFTSRYRGKRYSFGYPACPNLDDQQGIWKLLRPKRSACSSPKA
jgi:5-methyltetrahydrofolate--homocysteine methyltransferase